MDDTGLCNSIIVKAAMMDHVWTVIYYSTFELPVMDGG